MERQQESQRSLAAALLNGGIFVEPKAVLVVEALLAKYGKEGALSSAGQYEEFATTLQRAMFTVQTFARADIGQDQEAKSIAASLGASA
jgi:hypothetical protein